MRRAALLLAAFILPAAALAGSAVTVPPDFLEARLSGTHFSPNKDGVLDSLYFLYQVADSARLVVLARADSAGLPGPLRAHLFDDSVTAVADTVRWGGKDDAGGKLADGLYWITAATSNGLGTAVAPPQRVVLDVTAPRDSMIAPARTFVTALIHRVEVEGSDLFGLARFEVRLSTGGGSLTTLVCGPCLTDTVLFAIDVPDSIAGRDTLAVSTALVDSAGNPLLRQRFFYVDSLPPPPPVLDPLPAVIERPQVTIAGTAAEAESVFVSLDGVEAAGLRVVAGGRFQKTLTDLALGTHTVSAVSEDFARNRSTPSAPLTFQYVEPLGVTVPERFRAGDLIQVNLTQPAAEITVRIYALTGRLVRTLEAPAGATANELAWDLTDDGGHAVGSGPYVVRVQARREDGTALEARVATVVTR